MPTDAKCGLLVGVGLVLAVAVLFFQKDPSADPPAPAAVKAHAPAAALKPPQPAPGRPAESSPLAPGRPVSRVAEDEDPLQTRVP